MHRIYAGTNHADNEKRRTTVKKLVVYFSATGTTAAAAKKLAEAIGADTYEIKPEIPYVKKDLNWMNPLSRTTKEMHNKSFRPAIVMDGAPVADCDTIFLGFPIWWYIAPTIINTFLEAYDFAGKKIVLFATSGGSGFGKAVSHLQPSAPGATIVEGKLLNKPAGAEELKAWAESF